MRKSNIIYCTTLLRVYFFIFPLFCWDFSCFSRTFSSLSQKPTREQQNVVGSCGAINPGLKRTRRVTREFLLGAKFNPHEPQQVSPWEGETMGVTGETRRNETRREETRWVPQSFLWVIWSNFSVLWHAVLIMLSLRGLTFYIIINSTIVAHCRCLFHCMRACVSVWEGEIERDGDKDGDRDQKRDARLCVCVCFDWS